MFIFQVSGFRIFWEDQVKVVLMHILTALFPWVNFQRVYICWMGFFFFLHHYYPCTPLSRKHFLLHCRTDNTVVAFVDLFRPEGLLILQRWSSLPLLLVLLMSLAVILTEKTRPPHTAGSPEENPPRRRRPGDRGQLCLFCVTRISLQIAEILLHPWMFFSLGPGSRSAHSPAPRRSCAAACLTHSASEFLLWEKRGREKKSSLS